MIKKEHKEHKIEQTEQLMTLNEFLDECGKTAGKLIYIDKFIEVTFDSIDGIEVRWNRQNKGIKKWSNK